MRELMVSTPQPRRRARSLDSPAGNRAADTNYRRERLHTYGGAQKTSSSSSANNPERSSYHLFYGPAYRAGDKLNRVGDRSGPVGRGGGGGKTGFIAKLGWTDSSGSSNDEICSYLGDDLIESGGCIDGGGGSYGGSKDVGKSEDFSTESGNRIQSGGGIKSSGGGRDCGGKYDISDKKENGGGGSNTINSSKTNLSTFNSSSSGSEPDLHRDNLLRMVASDALGDGQSPDRLQAEEEHQNSSNQKEETAACHQEGDSSSVENKVPKPSEEPHAPNSQGEDLPNPIQLAESKPDTVEPPPANSEDEESPGPMEPSKAHQYLETLREDNPDVGPQAVNIEKAEKVAETAAAGNKVRGLDYVEPKPDNNAKKLVEAPLSAGDNRDGGAGSVEPGNSKQDVEFLEAADASLAVNDAGLDEGGVMGQMAVEVDQSEADSDEEGEMLEVLLELELGAPLVDVVVENEELEGGQGGAGGGRSWWAWLWKWFLVSVIVGVYTMAIWDAGFSTVSVASTNATVDQTTTGPSLFTRITNTLVARTGKVDPPSASRSGHDRPARGDTGNDKKYRNLEKRQTERNKSVKKNNDGKKNNTKNGKKIIENESKIKGKEGIKNTTNKNTAATTKLRNNNNNNNPPNNSHSNNNNKGDRAASSSANEEATKTTRRTSQSSQQRGRGERKERWRNRWAAWGADFEEMLDGPWV